MATELQGEAGCVWILKRDIYFGGLQAISILGLPWPVSSCTNNMWILWACKYFNAVWESLFWLNRRVFGGHDLVDSKALLRNSFVALWARKWHVPSSLPVTKDYSNFSLEMQSLAGVHWDLLY